MRSAAYLIWPCAHGINFRHWKAELHILELHTILQFQTLPDEAPDEFNPFTHTIETASRSLATSEPSAATARLQVTRMSCDLAGPLPATRLLSDRLGFERLDRAGHGCCMMRDAPRVLRKVIKVNAGFRYTRMHASQPPK